MASVSQRPASYDVLVRGGRVFDGSGNPAFRADIAIDEGTVVAVGGLAGCRARHVIDGDGLAVCPGFVDMHTHSDLAVLADPSSEIKIRQGVTLEVLGQDGLGYVPLFDATLSEAVALLQDWNGASANVSFDWRTPAEYVARMRRGATVNTMFLAPHGTIRLGVMGMAERSPSDRELEAMKRLVAECMQAGAAGLSTGLQYVPAMHATDEELVELCRVVATFGGYFAPHHRCYGRDVLAANDECIRVAEQAGVALHLTHAHMSYPVNAGRAGELLEMVDDAVNRGVDITLDSYPYVSGNPYLRILLPAWMIAGGEAKTLARLGCAEDQERLRHDLEIEGFEGVPVDWQAIEISGVADDALRKWVGSTIAAASERAGMPPLAFFCRLLAADHLQTKVIEHIGNEDNVRTIMQHVAHMGCSDGILVGERPHPRGWGTFPRYLGLYVRELGVLTWEQAIRKLTSLPALRLGLYGRGLLRPGMAADVVCFDPATVAETASFAEPRSFPVGIPHVVVNGVPVIVDGSYTGERPGRLLTREGR
jgi:N-acyl-D-amino-acid deacylase